MNRGGSKGVKMPLGISIVLKMMSIQTQILREICQIFGGCFYKSFLPLSNPFSVGFHLVKWLSFESEISYSKS